VGKGKRGRPKKPGKRHPGGQLVQEPEGPSATAFKRVIDDSVKLSAGALLGTQLGRLGFLKALTPAEVATGFRIAMIYGAYERSIGRRRSAASPSYEIGRGRDAAAPESEEAIERARMAARAFGALQAEIKLCPRNVRAALEELCVEDRACLPGCLLAVRVALGMLAEPLGVKRATAAPKPQVKHSDQIHKIVNAVINPEREAFIETITRLGFVPVEDAAGVYGHFRALVEREKFRKGKG
jgi:hypothetical protein